MGLSTVNVHRWRKTGESGRCTGCWEYSAGNQSAPYSLSDLGVIAKYARIFTILGYTLCPALLALSSRAYGKEELATDCGYSSQFSSLLVLRPAFLSAVVLVVIVCDLGSFE
jgi:hypothetical protein